MYLPLFFETYFHPTMVYVGSVYPSQESYATRPRVLLVSLRDAHELCLGSWLLFIST